MTAVAPDRTVHSYKPRGGCRAAWEARDDEVLVSGPAGTGKSRACLEKLHMMALLTPGMKGLIVRKTLASLGSSALETWRKFVIPEMLARGDVVFYGGSQEEPPQYRYRNGSKIVVGGMDKATRIMSTEYDAIYVQEATELTSDDWEALTTRLRNWRVSFQQLLADCNPGPPKHWLKERAAAGAVRLLESRHEDNPVLFDELPDGTYEVTERGKAYLAKLDALTGVRYLRLRKGMWVAAEGIIFEEWDEALHLIDRFPIPEAWPRWWVVDFGHTHPFVAQWWAEDPDGRLFRYREIHMTRRLVEDHAKTMLRAVTELCLDDDQAEDERDDTDPLWSIREGRRRWTEPRPRALICDHDAEGRATLEKHLGMSTVKANKTVSPGLEKVRVRMRPASDGRPRVFLLRDSVIERDTEREEAKKPCSTEEEIPGYVWAVKPGGELKEEPAKDDDDGCDAMRYMVAHRDLKPRANIRWM